ncbi:MAG: hypothetical protein HGA44_07860, partial [Cellulomonadaceae bacterium]|nr:hypothetical protein [Cellulomonadaceae bacterium]
MRRRVDGIEAVGLAYLTGMVAVGTALAWPVYATPRLWLVAGVGTLVGGGLVVLGRARGWSGTTTALTVLAAYLLVVGPVAVPSSTRSVGGLVAGVGSGLTGAVLGWKQLLTLSLPAEQYQAVLAPFLAAVVVATASAAGLSLRRGAGVSWAVLPLLALALVGPAFGPVQPEPTAQVGPWLLPDARTVVLALAAVGLSVVWLGLRDRMVRARALRLASVTTAGGGGPRRSLARGVVRAGLAAVVVVVAAAVGVAASAGAAGVSERRVLREEVEPVLAVQRESAPLDAYRAFFADDALDAALFEVSVTGEDAPDRLVVAVLDSYDGVRFTVSAGSGTFARLPRVTGREGTEVEVTIRDWSAVWVPVPEDLERAPVFGGARADQLAASFFVSGSTGAAVQVA